MTYIVEFVEKALVRRIIQCEVQAESEEDAVIQIKNGNYNFIDSWDDDDLHTEFVGIENIEEGDDEN